MTKFEKWFIRRIFKRDFVQSTQHSDNISNIYAIVREICNEEFTEDNEMTRDVHLRECFESTQCKSILPQFNQAKNMEQIVYDLHDALGIRWGDNPYLTIENLKKGIK